MKKRKNITDSIYFDFLYLLSCAVNNCTPNVQKVQAMNLSHIYRISRHHSLEAVTYHALASYIKNNQNPDDDELFKKWEESKNKIIRKTLLMNAERQQLFAYFNEKHIWHLPLKGIILSQLYPEFGMRQMADNDILFDENYRKEVRDWFINHGYHVKSYDESNHDEYHKDPIYNFEMHVSLFHKTAHQQYYKYFQALKYKLQQVSKQSYEYKMSDEDFYIYMIVHNFKHYDNGGIGIRSLLDMYIYNKVKVYLDHHYIKNELTKINLYTFEEEMRKISQKIFDPNFNITSLTEKEQNILQNMFASHTYGTIENHWKKQIQKSVPENKKVTLFTKCKYLLRRFHPTHQHMIKWCETEAPFCYQHPWLMPVARIKRLIRLNKAQRQVIKREIHTICQSK